VKSVPRGPRLGVAPAGKLDEALYFWHETDQIEETDFADALTKVLNRQLEQMKETGVTRPEQLELVLLIESSAPCYVVLDSLQISYCLVSAAWTDVLPLWDEEKRVLRFTDECIECRTVEVVLPASASVNSATLRAIESWGGGGGASPAGSGGRRKRPTRRPAKHRGKGGGRVGWLRVSGRRLPWRSAPLAWACFR